MSGDLENMASDSLVVLREGVLSFRLDPDSAMSRCLRVFSTSSTTKATSSWPMALLDGPPSPSLLSKPCGVPPLVDLVTHDGTFVTFAGRGPLPLACFGISDAANKRWFQSLTTEGQRNSSSLDSFSLA